MTWRKRVRLLSAVTAGLCAAGGVAWALLQPMAAPETIWVSFAGWGLRDIRATSPGGPSLRHHTEWMWKVDDRLLLSRREPGGVLGQWLGRVGFDLRGELVRYVYVRAENTATYDSVEWAEFELAEEQGR